MHSLGGKCYGPSNWLPNMGEMSTELLTPIFGPQLGPRPLQTLGEVNHLKGAISVFFSVSDPQVNTFQKEMDSFC